MSRIKVDIEKLKNEVDAESVLKDASDKLQNVIDTFPSMGVSRDTVIQSIVKLKEEIDGQYNSLDKMEQSLSTIADLYEKAEAAILDLDVTKAIALQEIVEKIKKVFDDIRDTYTGMKDWYSYGGDPVNLCTGNYISEMLDLRIQAIMPMEFKRYYNSFSTKKKSLGIGWSHSYEISLRKVSEQVIVVQYGDGRNEAYESKDGHYYRSTSGINEYCMFENGRYILHTKTHSKMIFNAEGLLNTLEDSRENQLSFSYENGKLRRVTARGGEFFSFCYDEAGFLHKVEDHANRVVTYEVVHGELRKAVEADGGVYQYEYDELQRLIKTINPLQVVTLVNRYDAQNRVIHQKFPDGNVMEYQYQDADREITFIERNGSKTTYVHDELNRHVATKYASGSVIYQLDEYGNKLSVTDAMNHVMKYTYDDKGNVTSVTDPLGNKKNYTYNANGRLTSYKDAAGHQTVYTYDGKGRITKIERPLNQSRSMKYNDLGLLDTIVLEDGSKEIYQYDEKGNMILFIDPRGGKTTYEYDVLNRMVKKTDGNNHETLYTYDAKDRVLSETNALGNKRTYTYNLSGKLTEFTDFDGLKETWEYNQCNLVTVYTDKEGKRTNITYDAMWNQERIWNEQGENIVYTYDSLNRVKTITNSTGTTLEYEYDLNGNVLKETASGIVKVENEFDACNRKIRTVNNGVERQFEYDECGHVVKCIEGKEFVSSYEYDALGNMIYYTDSLGYTERYQYNSQNKLTSKTEKNGGTTKYRYEPGDMLLSRITFFDMNEIQLEYDVTGNLIKERNLRGHETQYEYNEINQLVGISSNLGYRKKYSYDASGHVSSVTDGNNDTTYYEYSPMGNLLHVTDPMGNQTSYKYDDNNFLLEVVNESGRMTHKTIYERDLTGRIRKMVNPLGDSILYEYDALNRIISIEDEEQNRTTYQYTDYDQLENIRYADGRTVRFEYDQMQHLSGFEDWNGKTKVLQDALGRTLEVKDSFGQVVSYKWGGLSERKAVVYCDGKEIRYEYDKMNRLVKLIDGEQVINYRYDIFGNLTEKILPNGTKTSYDYNSNGMLKELCNEDVSGIVDRFSYAYDACGNMTKIEKFRKNIPSENGVYEYQYDGLGRITGVLKNQKLLRTYQYDGFGNRIRMIENEKEISYSYNDRNQLLEEVSVQAGTVNRINYVYDKRGNLVMKSENGMERKYHYDTANRLDQVWKNGLGISTYVYNGLGRKIASKTEMDEILYVNDLTQKYNNLLTKKEKGGVEHYTWDGTVASVLKTDGAKSYFQHDNLGSLLGVYDETGKGTFQFAYDEFGRDTVEKSADIDFGFTGYRWDSCTQDYYANARHYDPFIGRFDAVDVIKGVKELPATQNEYTYVINNPLKYLDEDGEWIHLVIGTVVGGIVGAGVELYNQTKGEATLADVDWKRVGVHAAGGAVEGLVTAANPIAGAITTGLVETGVSGYDQWVDGGRDDIHDINWGKAVTTGVVSGATCYLGGKLTGKLTDKLSSQLSNYVFSDVQNAFVNLWKDTAKLGSIQSGFLNTVGAFMYTSSKAFMYDIGNNFGSDFLVALGGGLYGNIYDWISNKISREEDELVVTTMTQPVVCIA